MAGRSGERERQPWVRWQDWGAVVLGAYVVLASLFWTTTDAATLSTMLVLGGLLVLAGAWSLAAPASMTSEYTHIVLGVLLVVAPWAMGYTDFGGAAWTSWVIGVLAVLVGAAALPEVRTSHRSGMAGQH